MSERRELKFISGDHVLTLSPELIERVYLEWKEQHPGSTPRDITSEEFSKRIVKAMVASAVKLRAGTA